LVFLFLSFCEGSKWSEAEGKTRRNSCLSLVEGWVGEGEIVAKYHRNTTTGSNFGFFSAFILSSHVSLKK